MGGWYALPVIEEKKFTEDTSTKFSGGIRSFVIQEASLLLYTTYHSYLSCQNTFTHVEREEDERTKSCANVIRKQVNVSIGRVQSMNCR
jgi:hypothetical protein